MIDELTKDKLDRHTKELEEHDDRIKNLEIRMEKSGVKIDVLCDRLDSLVTSIKWLIGVLLSGCIGIFFYMVQQRL